MEYALKEMKELSIGTLFHVSHSINIVTWDIYISGNGEELITEKVGSDKTGEGTKQEAQVK